MGQGIASRLIILLTLTGILIIGGGMLLDYRLSRQEILSRLEDQSAVQIRAVISDLENWFRGIESATRLMGRILEQREYSEEGLQQMLRDIVANNDEIFGAAIALNPQATERPSGFAPYYFKNDGAVQFADLASRKADYLNRDWYIQPVRAGTPVWSEPYFDQGGGEVNMITYSVPVFRENAAGGRYLYAVVTADVSLASVQEALQRLHLWESSYGLLASRSGVMLSTRTQANAMRHYSELAYGGIDTDAWHSMFTRALSGETVAGDFPCPESDGRCTIRLGRLQSTGWPIGIVLDQDEVLAPLHAFEIKAGLIIAATLLLMALALYLVISRLTRPLQQLSAATEHMARGELDVPLPSARGNDEVARLVQSFQAMNRDLKTYIHDLEQATANRSRLEGELAAARDIQMSMLPGGGESALSECGVTLWARVRPARTVGGDLYTYFRDGDLLFLAVGDVSDKGVPAALFMARAISFIQQQSGAGTAPHEAMARLNDDLERDNPNCMFVTLFLGVLDIPSGRLRFASAGHTAPALLRDASVSALHQDRGPVLGLAPCQDYPDNEVQLLPGDRLAVFTDGIDEAFSPGDDMFGIERFHRALRDQGEAPVEVAGAKLFDIVDSFRDTRAQSDDITLLLLDFEPGPERGEQRRFTLGAGLTGRVHAWLEPLLQRLSLAPDCVSEVLLIAEELVTNVQKYAGLPEDGEIALALECDGELLSLEVRDRGRPFDPLDTGHRAKLGANTDSAAVGGLGVHLVTQFSDRQVYHRDGDTNVLRIEKDLAVKPRA
jgi:sigma-B regulation protein RsbU (phosphoserine phosphatase)